MCLGSEWPFELHVPAATSYGLLKSYNQQMRQLVLEKKEKQVFGKIQDIVFHFSS